MWQNHLNIAWRNLRKHKGFSTLNILGLAISLTAALYILLWVRDELSYDAFHTHGERIHAVLANLKHGDGSIDTWTGAPYPLMETLTARYPEVELAAAFQQPYERYLKVGDETIIANGTAGSPELFELFSFPFVKGEWREAFSQPGATAISAALAARLYGENWASFIPGAALEMDGKKYTVTGVFADIPANSSFRFDYVLNLDEQMKARENDEFPWGTFDKHTFLRLAPGVPVAEFAKKITRTIHDNHAQKPDIDIWLHPLNKMYLWSNFENGGVAGGRIEYVRIFGAAALFLLLIACINFMNLATAQASRRAKEVGIRKTVGASRQNLIGQYLGEAALIAGISLGAAVLLTELFMPQFRDLTGKMIELDYSDPAFWALLGGIFAFTSLLAGSYPAFFLSSFKAVNTLKGGGQVLLGGAVYWSARGFRQALVVLQFVLSGLLVISALVVYQQIRYIQNKNLGLDRDNVVHFPSEALGDKFESFKAEALRHSGVKSLSAVSGNPLEGGIETGDPAWPGKQDGQGAIFRIILTDHNFLSTLKIELARGRDFSTDLSTDSMAFLINETGARKMGLDEPIGARLSFWGNSGPVVGVVKDFHVNSLHVPIAPTIISISPENTWTALARVDSERTEEAVAHLENTFKQFAPGLPFKFDFLDDTYRQAYLNESRIGKLAALFALLSAFISCLGLFGLSAFMVEARAKEIGVRKVLGASAANIVRLLSKETLVLVGLSLLIASPFGWYMANKWLDNFAYRIEVQWWVFVLAGAAAIVAALLTVSLQSVKAALANPAESLRSE
jgi:putative ABC transport system permease protein